MYLCLHAVLWFGMAQPISRRAANNTRSQSLAIHAELPFSNSHPAAGVAA